MIDPQLLRKDVNSVAAQLANRKFILKVDQYTALESKRKTLQAQSEELQAKRNQLAKPIGMKKAKAEDAAAEMAQSVQCNELLNTASRELDLLQKEMADFLMGIPNLPHESVPIGQDEQENVEIKRCFRNQDYRIDVCGAQGTDCQVAPCLSAVYVGFTYDPQWLRRNQCAVYC